MGGSGGETLRHEPRLRGARDYLDTLIDESLIRRRPLCFDSPPLFAYLSGNEPISSLIAPILDRPDVQVVISVMTLAEAITPPTRGGGLDFVETLRQAILALPGLSVVDLDQAHAVETAIIRFGTGLKLPDAAVVATARLVGAIGILGNDRQWRNKPLGVPYHHMDDILALA